MKKNLILSLCMLVGLAACQKENKGVTSAPKVKLTAKHDASLPPAYTDMTLMSDGSYEAVWNGCSIKVTGTPAWDRVKYPTLTNGVPVQTSDLGTYDPSNWIDYANTGSDGNVFLVSQIQISLVSTNTSGFLYDLANYIGIFDQWITNGLNPATEPKLSDYVKDSYTVTSGASQVNTYTGKLIRVTTGSHLAIATMSYPLPTAQTVPGNPLTGGTIYDASYNQYYSMKGSYNVLTSATQNLANHPVSGTYKLGTGGVYTLIGTIIRADGTNFNFNTTIAP